MEQGLLHCHHGWPECEGIIILFLAGSARKALAIAIGEHTGAYPSYQAAPSFAYLIGDYTLNRTGTLAGPKNDYLIRALAEDGYQTR